MDQNATHTKPSDEEEAKQEELKGGDEEPQSLPNDYDMIFIYSPNKQK